MTASEMMKTPMTSAAAYARLGVKAETARGTVVVYTATTRPARMNLGTSSQLSSTYCTGSDAASVSPTNSTTCPASTRGRVTDRNASHREAT